MIRKFFVVWFDRSRSARAQKRVETTPSQGARARTQDLERQTKRVPTGQPLHFTEHKTRLSWKSRATEFSLTHITTHSNVFWKISLVTNSQQKNTGTFSRIHMKEYLKNPAKNALLLPCTEHLKNTAKKTPAHTTIFPESTSRNIERTLQKMHRCSCTGHLKNTAKMPCCSCTEKNIRTKQTFYRNIFFTNRQQKTPAQTRIFLESPPGISKNTAKILCCPPLQGI